MLTRMTPNPSSTATTHAIAWIDHHQASLLQLDAAGAQPLHLRAHTHATAQHGSHVRSEHEFFAQVCTHLDAADAVLVTGAKAALADFRHYVDKHRPHTAPRIAAYDTVDRPTENQLAAMGRKFFEL